MDEKIFNSNDNFEFNMNRSLVSFSDCPNKCIDGYIFNPYTKERKRCEYCYNRREEILINRDKSIDSMTNKSIEELLHLPEYFNGKNFDIDSIIVSSEKDVIIKSSLDKVNTEITDLMNKASIGELPKYSIFINLGFKPIFANLVYPLMMRYYLNGVSLTPYLSGYHIERLRYGDEDIKKSYIKDYNIIFDDFLERDLSVIHLDTGARRDTIDAVKGVMELRALQRKPTIIMTEIFNRDTRSLFTSEKLYYNLAYLISVELDKEKLFQSNYSSNNNNSNNILDNIKNNKLGKNQELKDKDFKNLFNKKPPKL